MVYIRYKQQYMEDSKRIQDGTLVKFGALPFPENMYFTSIVSTVKI